MTGPDRRALGWATALLALVMAVVTFTGPRGLFGGDEGVKLIQAFGVLEHGLDDPWLPYPAAVFDPEENNHPVVEPHVVRHHGHRYGIYPITFTAPSAVAWWAGGFWALHLLPLLGGVLTVAMTMRLALLVTGDRRWAVAAGVALTAATPLVAYAALFNEHAPGVGLFMAGVVACATAETRRGQLAAGALLGLAATLRGELLAAAPAMAWFVIAGHGWRRATVRRVAWIAVGALIVLAAFCAYNAATTGAALPGVTANRLANRPASRMMMLSLLYPRGLDDVPPPMAILLATVAVGGLALWRPAPRAWPWCGAVLIGLWCWYAAVALAQVPDHARTATGLFATTPFLVVGALVGLAPADERRRWLLAAVGAAILLTVAVVLTDADGQAGGLQFGARHLLAAVPLFTVGAIAVVRAAPRWFAGVMAVPVALALWATVVNLGAWHRIAGTNQRLTAAAARSPSKDLCSSFFWVPEVLAPLWMDRRISMDRDMTVPLVRMRRAGVTEITRVSGGLAQQLREGRVKPIETLDAAGDVVRYRIVF